MAHYVNNKALLECIEKYQKQKNEAIQNNTALPKIPEYFGEAIIQIATRFSRRSNFIGYSFRDEMISDAIEHALVAVDKFDANKSSNPFSYITTMVYYSFIRRIAKEKRQSYIRSKLIQDMPIDSFDIQDHDDDNDFMNNYMAFIQSHQNFDDTQEKKVPKQKVVQRGPLEDFLEDYQLEVPAVDIIDLEKIALELENEQDGTN
jgi:DNA-directed RNA polymerase specialized sigma24 family protein